MTPEEIGDLFSAEVNEQIAECGVDSEAIDIWQGTEVDLLVKRETKEVLLAVVKPKAHEGQVWWAIRRLPPGLTLLCVQQSDESPPPSPPPPSADGKPPM